VKSREAASAFDRAGLESYNWRSTGHRLDHYKPERLRPVNRERARYEGAATSDLDQQSQMARRAKRAKPGPKVVRCPHENTALVTGRGQSVLVHVDVGTANSANGMHNMYRSRLPVLLMAGRAPYTTHGELVGSHPGVISIWSAMVT
jgi:acetolactate synthase I/II/III large subunit